MAPTAAQRYTIMFQHLLDLGMPAFTQAQHQRIMESLGMNGMTATQEKY